jgi:fatty-acyl-CoA synthase
MPEENIFERELEKNSANYVPLSPITFLQRTAAIFPDRNAVIYGEQRYSYAEFERRCRQLASALERRGIGPGDTVAIIAPNTPPMIEAHYGVPATGAVLNPLNVRLDSKTIAFILNHGEAKVIIVDCEFSNVIAEAVKLIGRDILVINIADPAASHGAKIGDLEYEDLLQEGDASKQLDLPVDEWQALLLSYTSGTTGDPKGVVYHHRGAYLNSFANIAAWGMAKNPVFLWTLPIFHSLGWCFPWTLSIMAGVHVCLRKVEAATIFRLIAEHRVTHMCGAPVVLNTLLSTREEDVTSFSHRVQVMTAASPPPAAVIERIEQRGFDVLHVYGLTEVFGPSTICEWQSAWESLPSDKRAEMKARQGVPYPSVEAIRVVRQGSMRDVASDGHHIGEVVKRSNTIMRGYLKNKRATDDAFAGGWFHTGDLAVRHPDGYIQLKDRSKDIIISGGENISTIEVEEVLYRHPAVLEAAVVAKPDERWGETPCAFVALREGSSASEADLIAFCRANLPHFKAPRSVIFDNLPKTSTGKVQKFLLRERAKSL